MSAPGGVDLIDADFLEALDHSFSSLSSDHNASAFALTQTMFKTKGSQHWHKSTVEWFLVYLLTEIGVTPHNMRGGRNAMSLLSALQAKVRTLKQRRYDPWAPKTTIRLVKDYLLCIDELQTLALHFSHQLSFFEKLAVDLAEHEAEDRAGSNGSPVEPDPDITHLEQSAEERTQWAIGHIKSQRQFVEHLGEDMKYSLEALFQLRSIEQNDLAITADGQSKAVLIFTGVTTVFLPLSFFTSYFSMDLDGFPLPGSTETYFWSICGPVTLAIVIVIILFAFQHRLLSLILSRHTDAARMLGSSKRSRF
ncbi:hypothetical protein LTR53_013525 [Teratosphaeriaceae sp. CCFEE 6253]|nr:hypothetical protein LTR53_013525 [Teratosphaeriaceae sp. CCFEE 6253]